MNLRTALPMILRIEKLHTMSVLETVSSVVVRSLPEPHAGLLLGILFGIKATLSKSFSESLIQTGTIHIVALSGMNITMLISFVQIVFMRHLKRPIANLVSIGIIIGFIAVVGMSASVIRAAIMGCISLLAVNFGRKNVPIYALILAVSCMLLLNPPWLVDLSFQLSVLATLGIILFAKNEYPHQREPEHQPAHLSGQEVHTLQPAYENSRSVGSTVWISRCIYRLIEDDLRVTLAAQVFTVPLILYTFSRISLIAPLTNVLIGWLIAPIMVTGFVMIAAGLVWLPFAQIVGAVVWALLSILIFIVEITGQLPFASVTF